MYNLLIVDDKEVFRKLITRMSYFKDNQDKFVIKEMAQNGLEALEVLKTGDIDIVLTDIRMPVMNGIELLKTISKDKLCKCTILLSEYADFSYAKEGIINGAFDYIIKPVDDNKLKLTFDRAYDYMQSFSDKNDLFFNNIEKLADSMGADDEKLFLMKLDATKQYIRENSNSFSDMLFLVSDILEKLHVQILKNHAYLPNYIPLEKVCSLNKPLQNEEELIELFQDKIVLLRRELVNFKLTTTCSLVEEIWYHTISNVENYESLQQVAEKFYVNKKYLSALFKKVTGKRYIDFITHLKIERAKMLLTDSNLKVYNVAEMLGFADAEYFSKVFKNQTGMSPSSFEWNHKIL